MWKQLNQVYVSLTHYNSRSRQNESGCEQSAGLELSVRLQEGAELQQLTLQKKQCMSGDQQFHKQDEVYPFTKHSLKQDDNLLPAAATTSTPQSVASSSHSGPCSDVVKEGSRQSIDSVKHALLSAVWIVHAPSSLRLVLGASCDAAACTSPHQQPVLVFLKSVAATSSWQAASRQCQTDLLCRAFLQHYYPQAAVAACQAGVDVLVHLQPNSVCTNLPHSSCADAFLQAVAAAVAAHAKDAVPPATEPLCQLSVNGHGGKGCEMPGFTTVVTDVSERWKQLEHCIMLGEALQLRHCQDQEQQIQQQVQHRQQGRRKWLVQLCPDLATQGGVKGDQHQPCVSPAALWLALQAWASEVASIARAQQEHQPEPKQLEQQRLEQQSSDKQQYPAGWKELLSSLLQLQQQAQVCSAQAAAHQDPVAPPAASVAANGSVAGVSFAGGAHQSFAECLQMLKQLGVGVPLLLQPDDLDLQPCTQHTGLPQPSSMSLLLLMRLFVATRDSWLPMLRPSLTGSNVVPGDDELATQVLLSSDSCGEDDGHGHQPQPSGAQCPQADPHSHPEPVSGDQHASAAADDKNPGDKDRFGSTGGMKQVISQRGATRVPVSSWPDELLNSAQLWHGESTDSEDDAAITREERTLRSWINSVLHRNASSGVSSAPTQQSLLSHSQSIDSTWSSSMQQGDGLQQSLHVRSQSLGGSGETAARIPHNSLTPGNTVLRFSSTGAAEAGAHLQAPGAARLDASHSSSTHTDAARTHSAAQPEACFGEPLAHSVSAVTQAVGASLRPAAARSSGTGGLGVPSRGTTAPAAAAPSISSVSSLFGPELRSGVLLLEILELLQPGCIDWRLANKPPFASRTAQLKALENCQLALKVAQEELGLPLVSMSPRDVVLGRRKIILSLVYQLMRYNTMQLLESISAVHSGQQAQQGNKSGRSSSSGETDAPTSHAAAAPLPQAVAEVGMVPVTPPPSASASSSKHLAVGRVNFCSSSRKQRRQLAITEQDILDWANDKLQQVRPLAAAAAVSSGAGEPLGKAGFVGAPVIRSFKDPVLGSGVVLLQLLHVLAPELVDLSYVTAGHTAEQRQSNARYALALADKMGCSLFLVWEDLVDPPQPRMVLVLLASLMYHDLQRQRPVQASA